VMASAYGPNVENIELCVRPLFSHGRVASENNVADILDARLPVLVQLIDSMRSTYIAYY
jgi:hypothetical protein